MSDLKFKQKLKQYSDIMENLLDMYLPVQNNYQHRIYEAMRYSVMLGGKRLRPALMMAACEMLGGSIDDVACLSCAIEMIHTYSLIHDDLPAMDNDDYRRGKLTNHKMFGQATAILAGDGLLNKAFEIVLNCENRSDKHIRGLGILAEAAGSEGMIGGQVIDIEGTADDIEKLEYMYRHKTGALIRAAVIIGALIGGADTRQMSCLEIYSKNISLAFQIKDDILDIEGDQRITGKPSGSDTANKKVTLVTLMGMEQSKEYIKNLIDSAVDSLRIFDERAWFLYEMAKFIINRES